MEQLAKILLVDDQPRNLEALESILASSECSFVRAESADEALLAVLKHDFAAIILDIRMPGMGGLELAQVIKQRKRNQHVPILFLTAHMAEEEDVLQGYEVGGVDYLSKPINPQILRSKVAVFVDMFQKTRALAAANEALQIEITERQKVQEELRQSKGELESRVLERTAKLFESENRLSAILQNTSAIIYLMDAESRFVHVNRQFETIFGMQNEDVRNRHVSDVLSPELAATLDANNRIVLAEGRPVEFEETIPHAEGVHVYTSIKAPLFDGSQKPSSVVAVSTDMTERKRLEDALRDADRRKDEFLATLAHELRNPLAPVRYAVEVLHQKSPDIPELRWARDIIERQTQHMSRLIDDLLDVNRITRDKLELRCKRTELASIINAAVEACSPLIDRGGHTLTIKLTPEPVYLDADVTRLAQVFSNLLNNAAKYSKPNGQISLSSHLDGTEVLVTIKDTGIGIAHEVLPRIFDMFTQVGRSLEQSEGGLGIGLSLARRLVEMHGGDIKASSDGLGKGSVFTVRLPVAAAGSSDAPPAIPAIASEASSNLRVLVAEDNQDAADLLEVMLELMGHEVRIAHDGLEALEKAAEFEPHVMVLDIGMPKLNGYDTARRVRQQPWGRDTILIALTGWGQEKDKVEAQEAGFNIHLVKPVDPKTLQQVLASTRRPGFSHRFSS